MHANTCYVYNKSNILYGPPDLWMTITWATIFKRRFRLDIRKHVFSNRVVNNWNALPENCISSSTVNTFKKHISSALKPETIRKYYVR